MNHTLEQTIERAGGIDMNLRLKSFVLASTILFSGSLAAAQSPAAAAKPAAVPQRPWLDAQQDIDARVEALLGAMTLEEKVGQLTQLNGIGGAPTGNADNLVADSELYNRIRQGQLGSILNEINTNTINALQRVAVKESRLGIPLVVGRDVIHGYRTIFPIPLGQAASWDPELVEDAAAVAAREARAVGIHWTFAPMVDIARDPRWGRIAEGFGEDPVLASTMAAAMVHGFQGDDLTAPDRVAACVKHFACYGAAEGGRDYNTTVISPSLLRNVYLPSFKAAVDAGAATLMTSFNDVNGVPSSANAHFLHDVLRDEWGFDGFVVSDWESIREMIPHGYAADGKDAARLAANAGVNMDMASPVYHENLASLVQSGDVKEADLDALVREVLKVKFRLGLFDQPYADESKKPPLLAKEHLELARKAARESMVLLKNDNSTLPFDKAKVKKVAVIGPLADAKLAQLGTWIPDGEEEDSRTPLAAIREAAGNDFEVLYAPGLKDDLDRSTDQFAEAVAAAKKSDVVVLIVGERASLSGEASSRAIIDLPGAQNELVEAIAATGKPVVLVIQAGRPLTIARQADQVAALLYAWHAGTMAGPALVDLLWGQESPSGKLPVTFPKSVGQIPLYYNHVNTGRPPRDYDFARDHQIDDEIDSEQGFNSNYLDVSPYPYYPFGFGLSYTKFDYGDVELSTNKLRAGQTLAVRATVKNTGDVVADEVVQLYVRDLVGSLTRPIRELKAFRRVHLKPGEEQVIEFALPADSLAFFNNDEQRVLEPGKFQVFVGGSSLAPLAGEFEVVE
ncbi:MAG: beta-glucosidase BglX [Pirellulales bacterium]